ncbi:hypothetical protein BS78_07G184900 [Paspalum vaginatum]|nr:hypothetical protein BS78_07G184900 [Paspalum vaginatum]
MEPDADEDYMGDLSHFLPPSPSSRSLGRRKQPPTQAPAQARAKRGKGVPWQERRRQERERKQREEDARTMAGLAEAIPESNVGFRMLKQMGYDPKSRAAAEPVGIEIRRSRAGLGAEPVVAPAPAPAPSQVEKSQEAVERERRRQDEMAVELRARKSTQWKGRRVVWDYRKAETALAQLENREVEPPAPEGEEKEEGVEEVITEADLHNILSKLRDQYQYCLYCGCKYESPEALASECPGPDEDDH